MPATFAKMRVPCVVSVRVLADARLPLYAFNPHSITLPNIFGQWSIYGRPVGLFPDFVIVIPEFLTCLTHKRNDDEHGVSWVAAEMDSGTPFLFSVIEILDYFLGPEGFVIWCRNRK